MAGVSIIINVFAILFGLIVIAFNAISLIKKIKRKKDAKRTTKQQGDDIR